MLTNKKYSCAGVIRDYNEAFICGVGAHLGGCSVLVAKLKAILLGLRPACSRRFWNVDVVRADITHISFLRGF